MSLKLAEYIERTTTRFPRCTAYEFILLIDIRTKRQITDLSVYGHGFGILGHACRRNQTRWARYGEHSVLLCRGHSATLLARVVTLLQRLRHQKDTADIIALSRVYHERCMGEVSMQSFLVVVGLVYMRFFFRFFCVGYLPCLTRSETLDAHYRYLRRRL